MTTTAVNCTPVECVLDAPLALDQVSVFQRFASLVSLKDRLVVELGGCLPSTAYRSHDVRAWLSVDPALDVSASDQSSAVRGTAEYLPVPDRCVDAVFSCNCLQHVQRPDLALDEAARVLVRGGIFYANFGPIWSAPDGAHIEGLSYENSRYDFWTHTLLPAWSHLVFSSSEMLDVLSSVHGSDRAAAIVRWLDESQWTNRLTLRDYRVLFERPDFHLMRFAGTCEFGYDFEPPVSSHPAMDRLSPGNLAAYVKRTYGLTMRDLAVRDLEVVLEKR